MSAIVQKKKIKIKPYNNRNERREKKKVEKNSLTHVNWYVCQMNEVNENRDGSREREGGCFCILFFIKPSTTKERNMHRKRELLHCCATYAFWHWKKKYYVCILRIAIHKTCKEEKKVLYEYDEGNYKNNKKWKSLDIVCQCNM